MDYTGFLNGLVRTTVEEDAYKEKLKKAREQMFNQGALALMGAMRNPKTGAVDAGGMLGVAVGQILGNALIRGLHRKKPLYGDKEAPQKSTFIGKDGEDVGVPSDDYNGGDVNGVTTVDLMMKHPAMNDETRAVLENWGNANPTSPQSTVPEKYFTPEYNIGNGLMPSIGERISGMEELKKKYPLLFNGTGAYF